MTSEPNLQVVFHSPADVAIGGAEIKRIGQEIVQANSMLGLTGFLVSLGETFVGVIEGPTSVVISRLEEIMATCVPQLTVLREAIVEEGRFVNCFYGDLGQSLDGRMAESHPCQFADALARRLSATA